MGWLVITHTRRRAAHPSIHRRCGSRWGRGKHWEACRDGRIGRSISRAWLSAGRQRHCGRKQQGGVGSRLLRGTDGTLQRDVVCRGTRLLSSCSSCSSCWLARPVKHSRCQPGKLVRTAPPGPAELSAALSPPHHRPATTFCLRRGATRPPIIDRASGPSGGLILLSRAASLENDVSYDIAVVYAPRQCFLFPQSASPIYPQLCGIAV